MENNKDIKIETDEDIELNDNIRSLGKTIKDPDRDTDSEYEAEETKERVVYERL